MSDKTSRLEILRIRGKTAERKRDVVVKEGPVTIFLNDVDLVTLLCSPRNLDYLAVGFMFGEGLIKTKREIKKIFADEKDGAVWVETREGKKLDENILSRRFITTGCGKGLSFVDATGYKKGLKNKSRLRIPASSVTVLMREFQRKSELYRLTGGVHSAGLCDAKRILVFNEDIGRHNAIDKVLGECILKEIKIANPIMITSGRVSSEILIKAARSKIPVVISRSAPTDLAVRLACDLGITLVGFVRGSRMNVYSNGWRIVTEDF